MKKWQESETRRKAKPRRGRPGSRTRRERAVLVEASVNGRVLKKKSEWDELMHEVDGLLRRGELSASQAVMAEVDESPVMEQLLRRYGQERKWSWNDPTRQVPWSSEVESESDEEEKAFSHWWK